MELYSLPGVPAGAPKPINLADLGTILKMLVKNASLRSDMFADPEKTLARLNYDAHGDAVKFFASLKGADFHAASEAFAPAHPDAALGMAEC
jgi:hypothetical protein